MDREFRNKLEEIIETYILALRSYEKEFRNYLSKELGISESRLYSLPMDMWSVVGGLQNEYWMHHIFDTEASSFAKEYYDKTIQSFLESGKELTDVTENGVIFETMLIDTLKEIPGFNAKGYSGIPTIKTKFDFEGIGYKKGHGDIAFTINGIMMPMLIDAKYSTDRSQIISRTEEQFNNATDIEKQIIAEIHRGIAKSISYKTDKYKNQVGFEWIRAWKAAKDEKDMGRIERAKDYFKAGVRIPKILIYIFKDKGMWSSEVVASLENQVITNAMVIRKNNNKAPIGGAYYKDWLWYGNGKL